MVPGPNSLADIPCRSTWEHRAGSQPLGQTQVCVGTCLYAKVLETGTSTALLNQLINVQYNVLFHLCKLPSLAKGWQSTHHSRADTEHTSLAPSLGVTQKPWMHLTARNLAAKAWSPQRVLSQEGKSRGIAEPRNLAHAFPAGPVEVWQPRHAAQLPLQLLDICVL